MPRFAYLTRAGWLLSPISLFTDLSNEMPYPVMPLYLQSIGLSVFFIGLLEGVASGFALAHGWFAFAALFALYAVSTKSVATAVSRSVYTR